MKTEIKYIELKSGFEHDGPAWIGMVNYSKSGRTVYFNGKALKSSNSMGIMGNYYDLETGEEYWISGIKKDQTDRHWTGSGKIMIDKDSIDFYLSLINSNTLNKKRYEVVQIKQTDKQKFVDMENKKLDS